MENLEPTPLERVSYFLADSALRDLLEMIDEGKTKEEIRKEIERMLTLIPQ